MRIQLILCYLITLVIPSKSQQLGVTAGLTTSNFNQSAPFNKVGFGVTSTLFYENELPLKNYSYSLGLGYTQTRGNGTINYYNLVNDVVLSYEKMQALHYLQIPLLLKYNFVSNEKYKLGITAGMQYNFLLTAWQNPQRVNVNHDVTEQFMRNVLGYQTGIVYSKLLPNNRQLNVNLTYQANLTNIQKSSNAGFSSVALGVGFSFGH
jgi:hypothetical protein